MITYFRTHPWSLGAVAVILAGSAWLAFGFFGVHTLFIDEEVSEALPTFGTPAVDIPVDTPLDTSTTDSTVAAPDASAPTTADESTAPTTAPPQPVAEIQTEYSGAFESGAHPTRGTALVLGNGTGQRFLRFEGFETDNGPDLNVYLVNRSTGDVSDFVDLGDLKGNIGEQNYEIPVDVDLDVYDEVVIWCVRFGVGFGDATARRLRERRSRRHRSSPNHGSAAELALEDRAILRVGDHDRRRTPVRLARLVETAETGQRTGTGLGREAVVEVLGVRGSPLGEARHTARRGGAPRRPDRAPRAPATPTTTPERMLTRRRPRRTPPVVRRGVGPLEQLVGFVGRVIRLSSSSHTQLFAVTAWARCQPALDVDPDPTTVRPSSTGGIGSPGLEQRLEAVDDLDPAQPHVLPRLRAERQVAVTERDPGDRTVVVGGCQRPLDPTWRLGGHLVVVVDVPRDDETVWRIERLDHAVDRESFAVDDHVPERRTRLERRVEPCAVEVLHRVVRVDECLPARAREAPG